MLNFLVLQAFFFFLNFPSEKNSNKSMRLCVSLRRHFKILFLTPLLFPPRRKKNNALNFFFFLIFAAENVTNRVEILKLKKRISFLEKQNYLLMECLLAKSFVKCEFVCCFKWLLIIIKNKKEATKKKRKETSAYCKKVDRLNS